MKVSFRVVLRWGCPTVYDVSDCEWPIFLAEKVVVGLQNLPGSSVAIVQVDELYKTFIVLFRQNTLPMVGRVSDVERVVVTDSSRCFHG